VGAGDGTVGRMRPGEVEQWVVKVVDQLERGLRVEDDRVECKRALPDDPTKAARRVAGHANQAREDRILWIIGVDEKADQPVVGRAQSEPDAAAWWTQVEAKFDEVAPSPTWVNVPAGDSRSVLGLGFDTSRRPYVLRLATDNPTREVPWREGTRVRSANRFDLLKLLVPIRGRPSLSLLGGFLQVSESRADHKEGPPDELHWYGRIDLYIDSSALLILPDHRCSGSAEFLSGESFDLEVTPGAPTAIQPPESRISRFMPSRASALTAEQGHEQVVVRGSSPLWLDVSGTSALDERDWLRSSGELAAEIVTAGPESIVLHVKGRLHHDILPLDSNKLALWSIRSDS